MNAEIKTNVIKRNGEEVAFDLEKIINAIKGANKDVCLLYTSPSPRDASHRNMCAIVIKEN